MGLVPNFEISVLADSSKLIFEDTTGSFSIQNPGGYGSPNVAIEDIAATIITIGTPNGKQFSLRSTFLPPQGSFEIPAYWLNDDYEIPTPPDFINNACGDIIPVSPIISFEEFDRGVNIQDRWRLGQEELMQKTWVDKCYTFRYELYIQNAIVDYVVKVKSKSTQQLWLMINNNWVNKTSEAVYQNGYYYYTVIGTTDKITKYEIRDLLTMIACGDVFPQNVRVSPEPQDDDTLVLCAFTQLQIPLFSNVDKRLSQMAYHLTAGGKWGNSNHWCHHPIDNFSLALALLDTVKNDTNCGCEVINSTIESVNNILDEIQEESC